MTSRADNGQYNFDQEKRRIVRFVRKNPGAQGSVIAAGLKLQPHLVDWMLDTLVENGALTRPQGKRGGVVAKRVVYLTGVEAKLLRFVKINPGLTAEVMAADLPWGLPPIRTALRSLTSSGLIVTNEGRYAGSMGELKSPADIKPAPAATADDDQRHVTTFGG